jgi:pimeloyl-ACP methyl ester carboxylesterase
MGEFALQLIPQIDTNRTYYFLGVSLGGMISSELRDTLKPEKTIIISSAACREELPKRYRFLKYVPINRIVPRWIYKWSAFIVQPLFEPDRKKEKELFNSILKKNNAHFLKQTTRMIVSWDRECRKEGITHIHGTKDNTLPYKMVNAKHTIEEGSHMMVVTRAEEINEIILNEIRGSN